MKAYYPNLPGSPASGAKKNPNPKAAAPPIPAVISEAAINDMLIPPL